MTNLSWLPYPGSPTQWFSQRWPQTTTNGASQPALLLQPVGTTPGTWSTSGTGLGINAPATFAGNLLDLQVGGSSKVFVSQSATGERPAAINIVTTGYEVSGAEGFFFSSSRYGSGTTKHGLSTRYGSASAGILLWALGNAVAGAANNGFYVDSTGLGFASGSAISANPDVFILRDAAANTLAQRNGTNAQRLHVYDTYTNSTDYHRVAIATARATLSSVSGASVTATNLIPAGAVVVGVTSKVTTGLGTSNGTTGYQVGTAASANRWGSITGTAAGTSTDNRNWTSGTIECFTAATSVIITANGGNFNGTGVIYVSVQYLTGESD
jgi:hypothetical protein